MTTHCTEVCLCGAVQYDCPCPGPKETRVVQRGCAACVLEPQRELIGDEVFKPATPVTTPPCMTEQEAASNRLVRLTVFAVLGDLEGRPLPNPQALVATIHDRILVPPMWEQLVRDLISEAVGEERVRRQIREREALVKTEPADWPDQVRSAIEDVLRESKPRDSQEPWQSFVVRRVMQRMDGKPDPLWLNRLVAERLAQDLG